MKSPRTPGAGVTMALETLGGDDSRILITLAGSQFNDGRTLCAAPVSRAQLLAEPEHYQGAIAAAEAGARVLVIETCPASAPSWLRVLAAIPPRQTLIIWPTDGVHPIPEDRGKAH